jgi:toxin ParE1/3/4
MKRFPYLIMFTIDEAARSVNILRVFNTYLEPLG